MFLKVLKPFGKLKADDFHETDNKTQGEELVRKGLAEKVDEKDYPKDAPRAHRPTVVDKSKNKK